MRNKPSQRAFAHGTFCRVGKTVDEVPVILIVEDDVLIQGVVEDALRDAASSVMLPLVTPQTVASWGRRTDFVMKNSAARAAVFAIA
jgi:GR25 family glycosyltransferase involved in LPS biosynthesis